MASKRDRIVKGRPDEPIIRALTVCTLDHPHFLERAFLAKPGIGPRTVDELHRQGIIDSCGPLLLRLTKAGEALLWRQDRDG